MDRKGHREVNGQAHSPTDIKLKVYVKYIIVPVEVLRSVLTSQSLAAFDQCEISRCCMIANRETMNSPPQ